MWVRVPPLQQTEREVMWPFKKRVPPVIRPVIQKILDYLEEDKLWKISAIYGKKRYSWDFKLIDKEFRIKYGWEDTLSVSGGYHSWHNITFIPEHNFNRTGDEYEALKNAIIDRLSRHEKELDKEQLVNCEAALKG